jgi:hypothetical protein
MECSFLGQWVVLRWNEYSLLSLLAGREDFIATFEELKCKKYLA